MCAGLVAAQETSAKPTQPMNSITVAADGEYEAEPDVAILQFTLTAQEKTYKAAYEKVAAAAAKVRDALTQNGLDGKLAQVSGYSVSPQYDYKSRRYKVIAYNVTARVKIRTEAMDKLAAALEPIGEIPEASGQSFTYDLKDPDAAKNKAIEKAAQRAKSYANELAVATGRQLGELHYGSIDIRENIGKADRFAGSLASLEVVSGQMDRLDKFQPQAAPPPQVLGAEPITITAHVNCIFTLK